MGYILVIISIFLGFMIGISYKATVAVYKHNKKFKSEIDILEKSISECKDRLGCTICTDEIMLLFQKLENFIDKYKAIK